MKSCPYILLYRSSSAIRMMMATSMLVALERWDGVIQTVLDWVDWRVGVYSSCQWLSSCWAGGLRKIVIVRHHDIGRSFGVLQNTDLKQHNNKESLQLFLSLLPPGPSSFVHKVRHDIQLQSSPALRRSLHGRPRLLSLSFSLWSRWICTMICI